MLFSKKEVNVMKWWLSCALVACLAISNVHGAITIPGADGSDGALEPADNIEIDLSLAPTGTWDMAGTNGLGVYDPGQWAVVFKYTYVNIPSGVTVTFKNHPSRAPVVWLVQGDVTISGTVSLNGAIGHHYTAVRTNAEPGSGGFRGGRGTDIESQASAGFGPGAPVSLGDSTSGGAGGSYGSTGSAGGEGGGSPGTTYGNLGVFPLIGGSGGAGGRCGSCSAGGGGGGGGVRIVADSVAGSGALQAIRGYGGGSHGSHGGYGRIRVEANTEDLAGTGDPPFSFGLPGEPSRIWPDATTPLIRNVTLNEQTVPSDPRSEHGFPGVDMALTDGTGVVLTVETENVPIDATVTVRATYVSGSPSIINAVHDSGDESFSIWTATFDLADGFSSIQVRAELP